MLDRLHALLKRLSTWPVFTILLFLFLLANQGFQWRREALGYGVRVLDVRMGYSPQEAVDLLDSLGPNGRNLYALTEITLDLAFPLVYGGMIVVLLVNLASRSRSKFLILIPVVTAVFDLLENSTIAYLAWTFNGSASPFMWVASALTVLKNVFAILSIMTVLIVTMLALRSSPSSPASGQ